VIGQRNGSGTGHLAGYLADAVPAASVAEVGRVVLALLQTRLRIQLLAGNVE